MTDQRKAAKSRRKDNEHKAVSLAEAASQNWGTRQLERQIGTLYYERLLISRDQKAIKSEAKRKLTKVDPSPREFVRDPVLRGNKKLFASKYKLILPSEAELRAELEREPTFQFRALTDKSLSPSKRIARPQKRSPKKKGKKS